MAKGTQHFPKLKDCSPTIKYWLDSGRGVLHLYRGTVVIFYKPTQQSKISAQVILSVPNTKK